MSSGFGTLTCVGGFVTCTCGSRLPELQDLLGKKKLEDGGALLGCLPVLVEKKKKVPPIYSAGIQVPLNVCIVMFTFIHWCCETTISRKSNRRSGSHLQASGPGRALSLTIRRDITVLSPRSVAAICRRQFSWGPPYGLLLL